RLWYAGVLFPENVAQSASSHPQEVGRSSGILDQRACELQAALAQPALLEQRDRQLPPHLPDPAGDPRTQPCRTVPLACALEVDELLTSPPNRLAGPRFVATVVTIPGQRSMLVVDGGPRGRDLELEVVVVERKEALVEPSHAPVDIPTNREARE